MQEKRKGYTKVERFLCNFCQKMQDLQVDKPLFQPISHHGLVNNVKFFWWAEGWPPPLPTKACCDQCSEGAQTFALRYYRSGSRYLTLPWRRVVNHARASDVIGPTKV